MSLFTRLVEKLAGLPHQYSQSAKVAMVSSELSAKTQELSEILKSYTDKPDPFVAMVADAYQRKQEANIWKGPEG